MKYAKAEIPCFCVQMIIQRKLHDPKLEWPRIPVLLCLFRCNHCSGTYGHHNDDNILVAKLKFLHAKVNSYPSKELETISVWKYVIILGVSTWPKMLE